MVSTFVRKSKPPTETEEEHFPHSRIHPDPNTEEMILDFLFLCLIFIRVCMYDELLVWVLLSRALCTVWIINVLPLLTSTRLEYMRHPYMPVQCGLSYSSILKCTVPGRSTSIRWMGEGTCKVSIHVITSHTHVETGRLNSSISMLLSVLSITHAFAMIWRQCE